MLRMCFSTLSGTELLSDMRIACIFHMWNIVPPKSDFSTSSEQSLTECSTNTRDTPCAIENDHLAVPRFPDGRFKAFPECMIQRCLSSSSTVKLTSRPGYNVVTSAGYSCRLKTFLFLIILSCAKFDTLIEMEMFEYSFFPSVQFRFCTALYRTTPRTLQARQILRVAS